MSEPNQSALSPEKVALSDQDLVGQPSSTAQDGHMVLPTILRLTSPSTTTFVDDLAVLPTTAMELLPIMHDLLDVPMVHNRDLTWGEDEVLCDEAAVLVPVDSEVYKYGGQVVRVSFNDFLHCVMICDSGACSECFPNLSNPTSSTGRTTIPQGGPWFHRNDVQDPYTPSGTYDEVWIFIGNEQVPRYSGPRKETEIRRTKMKIMDNVIRDGWICVSKKCKACGGGVM